MYLFHELNVIPLMLLMVLWSVGGWLITASLFDLKAVERHMVGLGVGLVAGTWLLNILARFLSLTLASWLAAVSVLVVGIVLAWPIRQDLRAMFSFNWDEWLWFFALAFLFVLINRGLAIFDDYAYLPSVSLMGKGDIPPHFPLDARLSLGYHYFLLLFSAQFIPVTGAAPWTALDVGRGITMALYFILGGLLAYRITGRPELRFFGGLFVALSGGTRWIMLLLPPSLVSAISSHVHLIGATNQVHVPLQELLKGPWMVAGSGPVPFPFAFVDGILHPAVLALGGLGIYYGAVLLLLFLTSTRVKSRAAWPLVVIFLSSLSLANEIFFVMVSVGMLIVVLLQLIRRRSLRFPTLLYTWIIVFIAAWSIALIQGGTLTDMFYNWFRPVELSAVYYKTSFRLVWPPEIVSAHLGVLSLFQPYQLIAALLEIGPILLVLPLLLNWGKREFSRGNWFPAALFFSGLVGLATIFIEYNGVGGIRNTSRLFDYLLNICVIFAVPLTWLYVRNKKYFVRQLALTIGLAAMLGGFVVFAIELFAVTNPVASYNLNELDEWMFDKYWNRLPPESMVFDPVSYRAVTIFGRPTNSNSTWYQTKPEFFDLISNPDPYAIHDAGYDFMYYNAHYWLKHKELLDDSCVNLVDQVTDIHQATGETGEFRRLVDITACTR